MSGPSSPSGSVSTLRATPRPLSGCAQTTSPAETCAYVREMLAGVEENLVEAVGSPSPLLNAIVIGEIRQKISDGWDRFLAELAWLGQTHAEAYKNFADKFLDKIIDPLLWVPEKTADELEEWVGWPRTPPRPQREVEDDTQTSDEVLSYPCTPTETDSHTPTEPLSD